MTLKEYLETMNNSNCSMDCELKKKRVQIAKVPPPDKIVGIIISRDPTVDWLYTYLNNETDEICRRKILFASAIPVSLMTKVRIFIRNSRTAENRMKCLFDMVFQNTYWTHFHKCLTDTTNKVSVKFKSANAKKCADKWLEKELDLAINSKTKFLITLGNDVKKWIEKWKEKTNKGKTIEIINLPHPSGQNNPIWYHSANEKYREAIGKADKQIKSLMKLCEEN